MTKAELNARLATPLSASQLKKTPIAELAALFEQQEQAATKAAGETLCDEPNGIPKPVLHPLTADVRAHAVANYEKGGWDVVVECWSDNEIAEAIVGAKTLMGAIRKLSPTVAIFREQQNEARIERDDAAPKKPAHRKPGTTTVTPRGEMKAFKPGTIQAQVADMLRSGATIGDLRRVCIRKDGKVWKDSAIKGLFTLDISSKGYGVRTELHNGYDLWATFCSLDDDTTFSPIYGPMHAEKGSSHPDNFSAEEKAYWLQRAIDDAGYDPEQLHAVYFLVDPTAAA